LDFEKAIKDLNFFPGMFRASSYSSRSPADATARSQSLLTLCLPGSSPSRVRCVYSTR
jgi:hypothetical protein